MRTQVNHGLNLALKLDPARGPLTRTLAGVLAKILADWARIQAALDASGFVYFARFIPTPDNSALLVIAEFDLPAGVTLDARVLDLASRLDFLFDAILPDVLDAPPTTVAQDPAAFAQFIADNNRVHVLLSGLAKIVSSGAAPDLVDYPVYSAYPQATVASIVNGRPPGAAPRAPVSHALNLVLTLQTSLAMPVVLGVVLDAADKIKSALTQLGFVHFARFVPTPDNSALLVITEFDGPLQPYVMDFAIAIGDVFTKLLSFCRDAPPNPVNEDPDAFWRYVQKNNCVRFDLGELHALLPNDVPMPDPFDFPMYRAFPDVTVLDIIGRRAPTDLPKPAFDRVVNAPVDLDDVQGNVLRGYNANMGRHFVATIQDRQVARAWFARQATGPADGLPGFTSGAEWPGGVKPPLTLNVGFTFEGLAALGFGSSDLAQFPAAFQEGPAASARARASGDVDEGAPSAWLVGGAAGKADVMVSLHAFKPQPYDSPAAIAAEAAYQAAVSHLRQTLQGAGLAIQQEFEARTLSDGTIHFGYKDSIAQPRIAGVASSSANQDVDLQPAAGPGEFVLHANLKDIYGAPSIGNLSPELATSASFCVVRLLKQDVDGFETFITEAAAGLGGIDKELVAAKLVGRWRTGEPLSLAPAQRTGPTDANNFDYAPSFEYQQTFPDDQGLRCPLGAHIRRANPRTSRVAGLPYSRRLIRRGMPAAWHDAQGNAEVGLFGLFMCGDIARQFEFIQQQWLQGDIFASGVRGTRDPLTGNTDAGGPFSLPGIGTGTTTVPRLVTTRGSLYLFMPGLAAMRQWHPKVDHALFAHAALRMDAASLFSPSSLISSLTSALSPLQALISTVMGDAVEGIVSEILPVKPPQPRPPGLPPAPAFGTFDPNDFDPKAPGFISNPYPTFAQFRQFLPVHWVDEHGAFWVFDHANMVRLCTDPKFRKSLPGTDALGLFTMDPPRHKEVRDMMNGIFGAAIANAGPLATQVTQAALADIGAGGFDLVDKFSRRVPREILFQIMGIADQDDRDEVDGLARDVMLRQDHTLETHVQIQGHESAGKLALKLGELLAKALVDPGPTLLYQVATRTRLVGRTNTLSIVESVMTMLQFVLGGYLSTEFLISTGTRNLLVDGAAAWNSVKSNATDWPRAIDEMRRFDSPLGVIDRYAAVDIDDMIPGFTIPQGTRFMGMLGSANHDASVFASPELFDVTRQILPGNIAFGGGIHRCIGEPLQREVMPIVMSLLMQRFPNLKLTSPLKTPPWFTDPYFRSFSELDVSP